MAKERKLHPKNRAESERKEILLHVAFEAHGRSQPNFTPRHHHQQHFVAVSMSSFTRL